MSNSMLIAAITISALALVILFYFSFNLEKLRSRKAGLISEFADKARRFQSFIDVLPSSYVSGEVRAILLSEIIGNLQKQKELEPGNAQVARRLQTALKQKEEAQSSKNVATISAIRSEAEAKEIRLRLMDLFKCLQYFQKLNRYDKGVISRELKTLQRLYVETEVALHTRTADEALKQNKLKLAIHHLHRAMGEYKRANSNEFAAAMTALKQKLDHLEQEQSKQKGNSGADSQLSKAMEAMAAEEQAKLKKKL